MKSAQIQEKTSANAARDLVCPICGDAEVAFHSEIAVQINETKEPAVIFVCSASHTFFVPRCSLRHR
jgi:hypothetical protein